LGERHYRQFFDDLYELITLDSFSETLDFACASRTQNQGFQKNCPECCELYQQAVCCQKDQCLSVGRAQKVEHLKVRLSELCSRWQWRSIIMSVLATLNTRFETFTLDDLLLSWRDGVNLGDRNFKQN